MKSTYTVRKTNQVGTEAAARTSHRIHRTAAQRETHRELLTAHAANLRSHVDSAPLRAWRAWWDHRDYTDGATAALALVLAWPLLALLALIPVVGIPADIIRALTGWAPLWAWAGAIGLGVGIWTYTGTHAARSRARWLDKADAPVRDLFRPRYRTIDREEPPHRTTSYGHTPHGYSVEQYIEQQAVVSDSLRVPVVIRRARPGVVAITQIHEDLLARPVPWQPDRWAPTDDNPDPKPDPEAIWLGSDWDGRDVHAPLSLNGQGKAWLIAGAPGSGKSALINAVAAQIARLPASHRRLWVIDPADGVDLGWLHPLAYRLADNPRAGVTLLGDLLDAMRNMRPHMTAAGIDTAPPSAQFPWDILVIDELPELTINEDKALAKLAVERLAAIRRLGRKTDTSIVAITQDMSAPVIPTAISKIFSHRLCFQVSTYNDADSVLPGARRRGYHPEFISPEHPGRAILWDLSGHTELRCVGLYGKARHDELERLQAQPADSPPVYANWPAPVPQVNGHRPPVAALDSPSGPPLTISTPKTDIIDTQAPPDTPANGQRPSSRRSASDLRELCEQRGLAAGRLGLNAIKFAEEVGEEPHTIRRRFRDLHFVKRNGNYVHPECAR